MAEPERRTHGRLSAVAAILGIALVALATTACVGSPAAVSTADDLIDELMCPSSSTPQLLATSSSPEAVWMRNFIRAKAAEGWPKQRIVDTLVQQYGERILPVPPKEGFNLAAWITPFAIIFGGAGVVGFLLSHWLRERKLHDASLTAEMARVEDEDELRYYEAQLARDLEEFDRF